MSRYQDASDAHQRARFMRPDAHRWIRPDAARFLAPGTDPASVYPALAPAETKYNPNQPRVPAGNGRESGRWTDGSGGIGSLARPMGQINFGDLPNFSDLFGLFQIVPTESDSAGLQLALNETDRRYSVNLDEEEARGGHTQRDHIGKTDEELLARMYAEQGQAGIYGYSRQRHGSFSSRETANDLVNRTIEQNKDLVDQVANGLSREQFLNSRFGYRTGREAYRSEAYGMPYLRNTYEVGVSIVRDARSPRGYRVRTAYPRNSGPK